MPASQPFSASAPLCSKSCSAAMISCHSPIAAFLTSAAGTATSSPAWSHTGRVRIDLKGSISSPNWSPSRTRVTRIFDSRGGTATPLPCAADTFDIVVLFTVLSSILDRAVGQAIAAEAVRVLRSNGAILWYDLRLPSPRNRAVRAMRRKDITQTVSRPRTRPAFRDRRPADRTSTGTRDLDALSVARPTDATPHTLARTPDEAWPVRAVVRRRQQPRWISRRSVHVDQ